MHDKCNKNTYRSFSTVALAQLSGSMREHTVLADRLKTRFMLTINTLHNEMTLSAGLHHASGQPPARLQGQDYPPRRRENRAVLSGFCVDV